MISGGVILCVVVFFVGLAVGLPVGWVFLLSSMLGLLSMNMNFTFTGTAFFHAINSNALMGVIFFIFAGNLIASSGLAKRIVDFSHTLVGKTRGGLINVAIIATLFMSSLTGSSVPCISALIPLLVPQLEEYGYKRHYTTAVLCASSFLGYLIPPSVPALMYCLVAQQSVAALFLATVVPGLMLAIGYMILNFFICDRYIDHKIAESRSKNEPKKDFWKAFQKAWPALGAPVVIMVGIYGGICTPNEAGAVAVFYCLLVGAFVTRELKKSNFISSMKMTIVVMGMITLLLGGGAVFTRFLVREGAAQALASGFLNLFESKTMILLSINVFLLILGMFIEGGVIIILVVPMLLPLITVLDMNLVHLGSMVIVNIGLGVITPPYAAALFFGSRLANVSYQELVKPVLIYLFAIGIPVLLLVTFFPALSCWLPTLALGKNVVGIW